MDVRRTRRLRRAISISLVAAAGILAVVPTGSPKDGVAVLVMTRDASIGEELTPKDVAIRRVSAPPDGALSPDRAGEISRRPAGMTLAASVRRGEILTDVRLIGESGPDPGPGRSALVIPLPDRATVDLLHAGMHVSLRGVEDLAVEQTFSAPVLTDAAVVLEVLVPDASMIGPAASAAALVSIPDDDAARVAVAAARGTIAIQFGA